MENKKVWVSKPWEINFTSDEFTEKIEKPTEIIVKNQYSHISAGTELACIEGLESFFEMPASPGYTSVGEIIEKGEDVTDFQVGDMVYTMGPHTLYFKIDITDRWHGICVKIPGGLNPEHAAFTHMAGIAMTSLRTSNIELGDDIAVVGLGAIGNLAAQEAQLQGANVIGIDINQNRLDIAKKSGINTLINSSKEDAYETVMKLTSDKGVSTLIDASGLSKVVAASVNFVSLYGEVILLGSPRAPYETNMTDFLQKFHNLPYCANLKGALEFTYPTQQQEFVKHSIERNSKIIQQLMKNKKLLISPIYSHKMSPADAEKAYLGLRDKQNEYIGVVFDWTKF